MNEPVAWTPAESWRVNIDAPLPPAAADAKRVLDAACRELWGASHWERPRRGKRGVMPQSWKLACPRDGAD